MFTKFIFLSLLAAWVGASTNDICFTANSDLSITCICDPDELQELRDQISQLQDLVYLHDHQHYDKITQCSVGMRTYHITDEQITASSWYSDDHRPRFGRLDIISPPGSIYEDCWVPAADRWVPGEWIQIDLLTPTLITAVVTQGRHETDYGNQYVASYYIGYGNSTDDIQVKQQNGDTEIFQGNRDTDSYVTDYFPEPIVAQYFRLYILTWNTAPSLRWELLTC